MMSLLGIESLPFNEHFWHGDVFITRFYEENNSLKPHYEDVPDLFLGYKELIKNVVQSCWDAREPEEEIRCWQQVEEKNEKLSADRQIILERM